MFKDSEQIQAQFLVIFLIMVLHILIPKVLGDLFHAIQFIISKLDNQASLQVN